MKRHHETSEHSGHVEDGTEPVGLPLVLVPDDERSTEQASASPLALVDAAETNFAAAPKVVSPQQRQGAHPAGGEPRPRGRSVRRQTGTNQLHAMDRRQVEHRMQVWRRGPR